MTRALSCAALLLVSACADAPPEQDPWTVAEATDQGPIDAAADAASAPDMSAPVGAPDAGPPPGCDAIACGFDQRCVEGACVCDPTACADGWGCVDAAAHCRQLQAPPSCDGVTCPQGQSCDPVLGACVDDATPTCAAETTCAGAQDCPNPQPVCEDGCCRVCREDAECAPGQVCTPNGCQDDTSSCDPGVPTCDPGVPGLCGDQAPFCVQGCCLACLGTADCASGQECRDGECVVPPNCLDQPSWCLADEQCDPVTGRCVPQPSPCDPLQPGQCPSGMMCDPDTSMCAPTSPGCGLCNDDCTCPGGLICDGFTCNGCEGVEDDRCVTSGNASNLCVSGICLPGV